MSSNDGAESALAPLHVRDFRLLFAGLVLGQLVAPLQFVVQIFWVQETVADDVQIAIVGLIGTVRGAGMIAFGLYGGALADRFDRRSLLLVTQSAAVIAHLSIALLMATATGSALVLSFFFALVFASTAASAVDLPTRQAMIPGVLGLRLTARGVALSAAAIHLVSPLSIFGTGFLIDALDFGGSYLLATVGSLASVITLLPITYRKRVEPMNRNAARRTLVEIAEGLRYARRDRAVFWVIALTFVMMTMGYPAVAALGPTWITTVLGQSFREFGLIASAWSLAAFAASAALTRHPVRDRAPALVAVAAMVWSVSFVVFAGQSWVFAVLGNVGLGAALAMSQVASTTFLQHRVTDEMRGRVLAILYLNVGVAQLCALPVALVGQAVSLETLFPVLAVAELVAVCAIVLGRRRFWFGATRPPAAAQPGRV